MESSVFWDQVYIEKISGEKVVYGDNFDKIKFIIMILYL